VKVNRWFMTIAMLALATMAAAQSSSTRVAVVNGKDITQEELNKAAAGDLQNLETKRQQNELALARDKAEMLQKALDELVADRLIELEAAKNKVTAEQLLQTEVESNVETPSAAEMDAFYEAYKDRIPVPKAEALPQVKMYMIDQSRNRLRQALIDRLKKQYGFRSYLEPLRTEIATAGFPSKGPASAPVTIVEFSDFECPYCGGLFPTLKQVEKEYGDKLRIVYRQFPLNNIHPYAQKAAEASLCANDQKHFWEFHDSMFGNQRELSIADLKQRAVDMKLDTATFNQCLDSGKHAPAVQKDVQEGARAGITGTPALFINGRLLSGNQPLAEIKLLIDDELQRKQSSK
jgi:predicted DsbA family dithiol-disulfide isomerase/Skp family chaperone for outer membrane proteins